MLLAALELYRDNIDLRLSLVVPFGETFQNLWNVMTSRFRMSHVERESTTEHLSHASIFVAPPDRRTWLPAHQFDWPKYRARGLSDLHDSGEH